MALPHHASPCINPALPKDFVHGHFVGVFGDLIPQSTLPLKIAKQMDQFYSTYKKIEDIVLRELIDIVNEKSEIQLTVIKDPLLARTMRERVLRTF